MNNTLRLHYFDWVKGNSTGIKVLAQQFGWIKALKLAGLLRWRLLVNNPFVVLNLSKAPDRNEILSQHQMAPLVVLYHLLLEQGHDEVGVLACLRQLSEAVAIEFLKFNVPLLEKKRFLSETDSGKLKLLKQITQRFFNAEADLELSANDHFSFTVKHCHFAHYCRVLNVPQLAPLFCDADRIYFERYQPDVVFFRSKTLALNNAPCDFCFSWRGHAPRSAT